MWYSGAARDVIALGPQAVLVASDTGGLWSANRGGTALPLGDFERPDFSCVLPGVHGDEHIYAGGAGLYETDLSQTLPLLNWQEIPISYPTQVTNKFGVTTTVNVPVRAINRIAIARYPARIVVTSPQGVFWSEVPPAPEPPAGCLAALLGKKAKPYTGGYVWHKAVDLPDTTNGYIGLAVGPPRQGEGDSTVAVASWGTIDAANGIDEPMRLYWGEWVGGDLVMHKADMNDVLGIIGNTARATTMASCDAHRERMYAITSDASGFPAIFFRSTDAGQSWEALIPKLVKPAGMSFATAGGNQGNDWGRWCQSIAVSRTDPDLVVVSWRFGGFMVSTDAGDTWRRTDDSPHAHGDTHAVYFDPTDPSGQQIYLASDGGIVSCPDLGLDVKRYESIFNRQLADLQFQSSPARMFDGGSSAALRGQPAYAGGLQDNGCVAAGMLPAEGWNQYDGGGDGFSATWLWTGNVLWNDNGELLKNAGSVVRHSLWDSASRRLVKHENVPVTKDDPQMPFPIGLPYPAPVAGCAAPTQRNSAGQTMYAVGGKRSSIYGFYCDPDGARAHWEFLARFALNDHLTPEQIKNANYEPWSVSALGTYDGDAIFIGMVGGRIIRFEHSSRSAQEITVPPRNDPWGDKDAAVNRIVVTPDGLAFATYDTGRQRSSSSLYFRPYSGHVLRIRSPHAQVVAALPDEGYYGLELARGREGGSILFAATDSTVYVSRDNGDALGDTWKIASGGLPRRPHCADLSFSPGAGGERWLYLATYGRSVWRAAL